MARRTGGALIKAKPSARIGKAANPISRSGRRPQLCACRPTQGAISATRTCGTMISADMMSEEFICDMRTSASPASGRTEALASWNKNRLVAKMTNLESFKRIPTAGSGRLFDTMVTGSSAGSAEVDIDCTDPCQSDEQRKSEQRDD